MLSPKKHLQLFFLYIIKVTSGNTMSMSIEQHKMKHSSRLYSFPVNIHPGKSGARKMFAQTSGLVNSKKYCGISEIIGENFI